MEPRLVVAEHIQVVSIPAAGVVHARRRDARNFLQQRGQITGVLGPGPRLSFDPGHLRQQQSGLKFGHPQIGAAGAVRKAGPDEFEPAAVVVESVAMLAQIFVVADLLGFGYLSLCVLRFESSAEDSGGKPENSQQNVAHALMRAASTLVST